MPAVADLLAFEDAHRGHMPRKEEQIRRELGISPARYYQLLNRAIDTREALELDPILVRRLRASREESREVRQRRMLVR